MSRAKNSVTSQTSSQTESDRILSRQCARKIDFRIVPFFMLIYFLGVLCKTNYTYALVSGLQSHLKMTKINQGNLGSFFFVFYVVFDFFSAFLLKGVRPRYWLSYSIICWSVAIICCAFARTPVQLNICRSLFGVFVAGLTPGVILYMQQWYTRIEMNFRMSLFFSTCTLANVFAGPIAAALSRINSNPQHQYKPIFYIEGGITILVGLLLFFFTHDSPESCSFLNKSEKEFITSQLERSSRLQTSGVTLKSVLEALNDWKIWVYTLLIFCVNISGITAGFFSPLLIKSLGVSSVTAMLLSSLPNLCGFISQLMTSYTMTYFPLWLNSVCFSTITLIGIVLYGFVDASPALKIIFLCIFGFGAFPNIPVVATWMSVNSKTRTSRSVASKMTIISTAVSGIAVPYINTTFDAPKYRASVLLNTVCSLLIVVLSILLSVYFRHLNIIQNQKDDESMYDEKSLTQEGNPEFRYKL
ncbi:hypothetical protein BB560_003605 [Smittium megazygosporum]|uniref:Major facilitator superfamily (MFS) profile domain-containing protein n=1 Tax=Smittium megazygosporum TaxID=133381 RepID=A0A2T9ZBI1_9FUNG|nr:hypothetical protein BB560_003605 [Smittium megazygosporum]